MKNNGTLGALLLAGVVLVVLTACGGSTVSYSRDIKPILAANCLSCHQAGGAGYEASGFSMATYEDLMQGTRVGHMVIPGDSAGSNMLVLMEGRADPSINMPHGGMDPVSKAEIETIRRWIDQGAKEN
jgi:mono/diheme cytochrome c family protein